MRSVSWSLVVTRITGIWPVAASRLIVRVAWKPLRLGITTSIRIRSGMCSLAARTPAAPSSAVTASCPSFSTMRRMPISWEGESSTMRMRAIRFPLLVQPIVATGPGLPSSPGYGNVTRVLPTEPPASMSENTAGRP